MELASDTAAPEVGATDRLVTDFDVDAVVGAALLIGSISIGRGFADRCSGGRGFTGRYNPL